MLSLKDEEDTEIKMFIILQWENFSAEIMKKIIGKLLCIHLPTPTLFIVED